ncbi:MAG: phenylalanine--tRNA ligase subunit beta [Gammaproteobacteria bacterium]|nr:phenylalanine--tRNA ligase subunit beta [Gammaproteobacteria bacterium]
MKVSVSWLKELCPVEWEPAALAERLTNQGLETGTPEPIASPAEEVVAAHFVEVTPIPRTNYHRILADVGTGARLTVVTASPAVKSGMTGALALAGATLPDGRVIEAHVYAGVTSEAMLCSAAELGLGEVSDKLLDLPTDIPPGTPLAQVYGLPDCALEIDVTANRGDCFSMLGIARELHASSGVPLALPPADPVPPGHEEREAVTVEDGAACPRYLGRVVTGIDPAARTPLWLAERLRRAGQRCTHPVVDVLNYVMLESGQPLHAFDRDRLEGGIRVRPAREGEALLLLNGNTARLTPNLLVIADATGPVALAGVMGGAHSAVSSRTRDIFIESAFFTPGTVRGRARRLGLFSEASLRYERGVDPWLPAPALERATRLICDITGGTPGPIGTTEAPERLPERATISLHAGSVARLLGLDIPTGEVEAIFQRLGLAPQGDADTLRVTPPGARFDLENAADLVEEIARIVGYDRIPCAAPNRGLSAPRALRRGDVSERLAALLTARGYDEALTLSLVDPARDGALAPAGSRAWQLDYPLSERESVLRRSLWPGLLDSLAYNAARQAERVRLFEIGKVFDAVGGERLRLGAVLCGTAAPEQWGERRREVDFYDLKGDVEALLAAAGAKDIAFAPSSRAGLAPGRAANALVAGECRAEFGVVAPELAAQWDLPRATLMLELDVAGLSQPAVVQAQPPPRFPAVRRDLSLIVPLAVSAAALQATVRRHAGKRLTASRIFDVYTGRGIPEGTRSITMGLIFRDLSRTLTDAEVDAAVSAVISGLTEEVGVHVRSR